MTHSMKKLLALLLVLSLAFGLLPPMTLAASTAAADAEAIPVPVPELLDAGGQYGWIDTPDVGSHALTDAYLRGEGELVNHCNPDDPQANPPAAYDSRSYGYITAVGNQNPYGTCWSFASMASVEAYMIKHGIVNAETGAPAAASMNLSELHLAWFTYTDAYDAMGMLAGDSSAPVGKPYLDRGGNGGQAIMTMMRWEGPASESTPALAYSAASSSGVNAQYAYNYDIAHLEGGEWIPAKNQYAVKCAVMEYGAGVISYYHDDNNTYYNSTTHAYCYKQSDSAETTTNHSVTIVGWDDNYSRNNFNAASRPASNGAWIIKNSWGSGWGENGYFYLSYEDTASYNSTCYFFEVGRLDNFDHNYQYDGTGSVAFKLGLKNGCQIANVFSANGPETLRAVAVNTLDEAVSYTVEIYRNLTDGRNPASGTLVSTQTGSFSYPGYHTVRLSDPVKLSPGDTFSVVFTLSTPGPEPEDGKAVNIPFDCSFSISWASWIHTDHGDTSFYKNAGGTWYDCHYNGDYRIKAYTDDRSWTVEAAANNDAWGYIYVNGTTISTYPAVGYYLAGCEVVSGQATCTISGNTVYVTPASDCTIRVNFAPYLQVRFYACGNLEQTAYAQYNGSVSLPYDVNCCPAGWSFYGWRKSELSVTTDWPATYPRGSSYTVEEDTVFYAVYSREEYDGVHYQLVTEEPEEWAGYYVITAGKDADLTAFRGVDGEQDLEQCEEAAVAFADTGMTLNGTVLQNVSKDYVFRVGDAYYDLSNAYIIENYKNYLIGVDGYALFNAPNFFIGSCGWDLQYDTANNCMTVGTEAYGYRWLSFSGGYFKAASDTHNIQFWRETPDTVTYYATNPTAGHGHTLTHIHAVEPSCTLEGSIEYWRCADCGKCFSDFNGRSEISEDSVIRSALGHNWDAGVVTRPPTADEPGELTQTCLRCGLTRTSPIDCVQTNPFEDVWESKYYYLPVLWAYYHDPQITSGTDSTHFSPNRTCTREQIVTFLWKACGAPEPVGSECPFADVSSTKYFYKAVLWAVENGITSGVSPDSFGVGLSCTRAQVVTFLWIVAGGLEPEITENPFSDVQSGKYYYDAVLWAYEKGITAGVSESEFGVRSTCTRGQIVTFLYKAAPFLSDPEPPVEPDY